MNLLNNLTNIADVKRFSVLCLWQGISLLIWNSFPQNQKMISVWQPLGWFSVDSGGPSSLLANVFCKWTRTIFFVNSLQNMLQSAVLDPNHTDNGKKRTNLKSAVGLVYWQQCHFYHSSLICSFYCYIWL